MLKLLTLSCVALLFVACSNEKNIKAKPSMFQTVSKENATLIQSGKDNEYCGRCGMDLVKYYKTSHSATYEGKHYQYCSIHCLVDHLADGIELKNPEVVDVNSLKFISIANAVYVVDSNKRGTMSRISKYAFSNEKQAKEFKAKNSGEIMDFYEALEVAKKDFK